MTFDEWWDSNISIETPHTFRGWEASCRQAWNAALLVEREACAQACDQLQKNHERYYRTVGHDGKPYDPAHCALVIRERSNAKVTGDAASSRRPGGLTGSAAGSTEKG